MSTLKKSGNEKSANYLPGQLISFIWRYLKNRKLYLFVFFLCALLGAVEMTLSPYLLKFVPQVIEDFDSLSGGQRLNQAVTQALSCDPNVLLLDEPTNHLDRHNRKSLMRMLQSYPATLIVVSHDTELLRNCIDTLWHIDNWKIQVFSGNYDDYIRELRGRRASTEQAITRR